MRLLLPFCAFYVFTAATAFGQLSITPHSLYLSAKHPSAELTVTSNANTPLDVNLRVQDHEGTDIGNAEWSCSPWVELSQRSLHLAASGRTVVRIAIDPKENLRDGEYHARLVLTEAGSSAEKEYGHVSLHYRIGDVYSDVKLAGVAVERGEKEIQFLFKLEQLGNAAYRGNLTLRIQDGRGRSILETERPVDIYGMGTVRQSLPAAKVSKGKYRIFMGFNSDRLDLGDRAIPVLPKKFTVDISMS